MTKTPRTRPARKRTGKQTKDTHKPGYSAKLKAQAVKDGKCRQCFKKRDKKSPSTVRCSKCDARHRELAKKYAHDKVSQKTVKTRKARETQLLRVVRPKTLEPVQAATA